MISRSLALLIVLFACAASAAEAAPVVVAEGDRAVWRDDPLLPPDEIGCATPPEARASARVAPPARAAARETVRGAIRRVERAGAITAEQADRYRRAYSGALRTRARLGGGRRAELSSVIETLESFARQRILTSSRMPALFLQLERNTQWWAKRGGPRVPKPERQPCAGQAGQGGARVEFPGEPVVFQWYPGQGLQIQELATFGKVNALAKVCLGELPGTCRPERLRAGLDRIVELAVDRGGFIAWEYFFSFGGGRPPWISGLAQGTAMQALTRGAKFFNEPRYLETAGRALGAFETNAPRGVRVWGGEGWHYLIYSFNRGLRVLNGFLQALVGLYDYAEAADDDRARELFRSGERQARREVPGSDTGAWSRYSAGGAESDLGYHRLVRDFLRSLCDRTKADVYCSTAERFTRYQAQPARLRLLSAGPPLVRFRLSKISCVTLRVSKGGRLIANRRAVLSGGVRALGWAPRGKGRYTVTVIAEDLNAHKTRVRTTVRR